MKFRQQRTALFISVLLTAAVLFCSGDVFAADGEASAGTAWQNNKAAWKTWLKDKTPQGKIPGTTVTDAIARELDEELKPELNGKSLDELEREALNAIAGKIGLDIEGELAGKDISGLEIEYREYLDANARLLGFTLKPEDRDAIVQRMTRGIVREIVREGIAREIALRGFLKWADRYFPNGIKISRNRVPSYWYYQNNGVGATVSNETLKKFTSLAEILHAYPPDNPFSNGAGPDHFLKFVLELENKLNKKKWFDTDGDGVYLVVPAPPSGTAPPPAARAVTVDGKLAAGEKLTATSTGDLTGDFAWESADDSENFDPATATWT
ncbi:MAG: hypothetical protein LBH00_02150, partial [Planctomycetaceae bacterium]|nr:hypothetical protein [Planctomycetaceae bacterium]